MRCSVCNLIFDNPQGSKTCSKIIVNFGAWTKITSPFAPECNNGLFVLQKPS